MRRKAFLIIILLSSVCCTLSAQYDKEVFSFRGRSALADGKYAQAIEHFNVLAHLDTTDYWTFFYRGIAKYNLGDIRGAQQDFDTSVRLDPVFTDGYHYRAITKSRFGAYEDALKDLQRAIELRPGFIGLYFSRGVTYFLAQQFENAVADFDRYIKREPRDPAAYLNRGASYLFLGDTLKAMNDYNKAIKLDHYDPEGYIRRGRLYADQEKFEEALQDMNKAIELEPDNSLAHFNRALMHYELNNYNAAMEDLNEVLKQEPGNALTLYNRSLINAQVGNYEGALEDMDRVININPGNVLAYYNRAAFFAEMGRWYDALDDYDRAIELYPDFAKAYLNRSYVENMLGLQKQSKADYQTAQKKVSEYRMKSSADAGSFADTTRKYSGLIALDAEFAKKDFDDELLQHRDIDIRLKPLYKFNFVQEREEGSYIVSRRFENALLDKFLAESEVPIDITNSSAVTIQYAPDRVRRMSDFLKGLNELQNRQFNQAQACFDNAVEGTDDYYKAFYYLSRGVLKADMIEFISSIQSNVQTLTMDNKGTTRARVGDQVDQAYDYSDAISDLESAAGIAPDIPYIFYNLGNLYCLSSQLVNSIENYDKAIKLYPYMGDAYYNRGLVLIYLKDKDKACIDLSRAGELGVTEAYSVISKYCEDDEGGK